MIERLGTVLAATTRRRLAGHHHGEDGRATLVEVEQWVATLVAHIGAAVRQAADIDGLSHALRTRALLSEGEERRALTLLADEVAAAAIEREAARIITAAAADLEEPL